MLHDTAIPPLRVPRSITVGLQDASRATTQPRFAEHSNVATLRATAQAAISAFGVRFEPPAIAELYRIIEEGVIQMKLSKEDDDLEKISKAQRNLVGFIGDIVRTCKERELTTVDDKTVREVRKIQLCPVYPFK